MKFKKKQSLIMIFLFVFCMPLIKCGYYKNKYLIDVKKYSSSFGENKHIMQVEIDGKYNLHNRDSLISSHQNIGYDKAGFINAPILLTFKGSIVKEYVTHYAQQEILERSLLTKYGSYDVCVDTTKKGKRNHNDSAIFILAVKDKKILKLFNKIYKSGKIQSIYIDWSALYSEKDSHSTVRPIQNSKIYYGNLDRGIFNELYFYGIKDSCLAIPKKGSE
jgi:hypothetical protein